MTESKRRSPQPLRFSWEASDLAEPRAARHPAMEASETDRSPAMDAAGESRGAGLRGSKRGSKYQRGGFLLPDAVALGSGEGDEASGSRRKPSRLLHSIRPKGSSKKDRKTSAGHSGLGLSAQPDMEPRSPASTAERPSPKSEAPDDPPAQDSQPERPPLDVESAHIVDMALRISQSRRAASQRVVSQHAPPRLAPLPDTAGVSGLRQHLLQQRKLSRTGSPRPRNASTLRHALDSFDVTAQDGSYRYHISRSTLGRAQRAKEYMELMAQYRRLLGFLPPLRAGGGQPPASAGSERERDGGEGRRYNPLQYIRNRKVRARERQPLDGEAQGFRDVAQVTSWVDEVADWSSVEDQADEAQPPPMFAAAERQRNEVPTASEGSKAAAKLARRRIDWLVEPADLIADAYWLEQGSNKSLIQDRHWDRLYPRMSDASLRPPPQLEERQSGQCLPATKDQNEEPAWADEELSHTSPRARRLNVRGIHRRHSSSGHNHDFLRLRRSASDISDSDGELKEIPRTGTMTSSGKDILEKQMMEMIAREEREGRRSRSDASPPQPTSDKTEAQSSLPSRIHSRNGSLQDISESEKKGPPEQPRRPTRLRVDVPARPRRSLDADSAPNSPEHPPSRDSYGEFSPVQSRPASPPRNALAKVRHYFGDRGRGTYIDDRIRKPDGDEEPHRLSVENAERRASPERWVSGSPARRGSRRTSMEGRGHLRVPSVKMKGEEAAGVRGMLKAPARIDNVLRSGVSKIGDIIWRKDSDDAGVVSETTTDESEERAPRARAGSRPEDRRSYLENMPAFTPERAKPPPPSASGKSSRRPSIQSGFSGGGRVGPTQPPVPVPEAEPEREARPVLPPSLGTRHFSVGARAKVSREEHGPISRREIARVRALLLSSGVMAMEISRRANAPRQIGAEERAGVPWGEMKSLGDVPERASPLESYPLASRLLEDSITESSQSWQEKASAFASETAPSLHTRLDALRIKLAVDLSSTIRGASDEADEVGREATQTQRLRVKRVVDVIEKMLRRRRRRFRWVRRGMWLGVEWVLVGCMWYVWFVVMVVRVLGGVGRGAVGVVRWLLWM